MVKPRFGRLEQVRLNDIWDGQGREFLPWLAKPDNLSLIGEVLGLNLSVEGLEEGPEPDSAFLLCRDASSGMWVAIENPVTTTEYVHLGPMLAHAAKYNPVNLLWMAGLVHEDHKRLLHWLNTSTTQGVNFFALEIAFWRIGDSPFAPNFELISAPPAWGRDNGAPAGTEAAPQQAQEIGRSQGEPSHPQGLRQAPDVRRNPQGQQPARGASENPQERQRDRMAASQATGSVQAQSGPTSRQTETALHPDQRARPPASGSFQKRSASREQQVSASQGGSDGSPEQGQRAPQTPSGLLRAAAARPSPEPEPQRPSGLFQGAAQQTASEPEAQTPSGLFRRADPERLQEAAQYAPSGMLQKAAEQREGDPADGGLAASPVDEEPMADPDGSRHPTLVSFDDDPPDETVHRMAPMSLSMGPDTSSAESEPGMMQKWQTSEATVTPSGMLRRMEVSGTPADGNALGRRGVAADLDANQQVYLEFWTAFWEDVVQWESQLPPERPMAQGWVTFPVGREDFYLVAFVNGDHNLAGMGLVIEGPESKSYYHQLHREKDSIEAEFGYMLDWRELPAKEESHIYLHKRDVDPSDRSRWREYQQWFAEALETFTHVLGTRVRALGSPTSQTAEALFRKE